MLFVSAKNHIFVEITRSKSRLLWTWFIYWRDWGLFQHGLQSE